MTNNIVSVVKEKDKKKIEQALVCFENTLPGFSNCGISETEYAKKVLEKGFFFSAELDKEILGIISGYANDFVNRCAYASLFAIRSDIGILRGLVFKKLILATYRYAKAKGMKKIALEVRNDNTWAVNIYITLGFEFWKKASETTSYYIADINNMSKMIIGD